MLVLPLLTVAAGAAKPNVLFIANDDLRPMISRWPGGAYSYMQTPNLDAFLDDALLLTNSHVQQAVCGPSRASLLFGRRPGTTHVTDLYNNPREVGCADCLTIPGLFKEAGYFTLGMGKIFHDGHASNNQDPQSWTDVNGTTTGENWFMGTSPCEPADAYWLEHATASEDDIDAAEFSPSHSWNAVDENVTGLCRDSQVREHGLLWIRRLAAARRAAARAGDAPQPFFLAVGFRKPHLPFVAPQRFFDLYDPELTALAPNPFAPSDMPPVAYASYELQNYGDVAALNFSGHINETLPDWKALELVRAYQAALSYTDSNFGALLDALKAEQLWNSTVVCFWGDHGWKLGHHGAWAKHTNFEEDTLSPVLLRIPRVTDGLGLVSDALVEHVDLMATLVEVAGLPAVPVCPEDEPWQTSRCTEGLSLLPLVSNPARPWKNASYSLYPRGGDPPSIMGYSMRMATLRFTAWVDFDATHNMTEWTMLSAKCGFELYNLTSDPLENTNLAYQQQHLASVQRHFGQLRAGWRATASAVGFPR